MQLLMKPYGATHRSKCGEARRLNKRCLGSHGSIRQRVLKARRRLTHGLRISHSPAEFFSHQAYSCDARPPARFCITGSAK